MEVSTISFVVTYVSELPPYLLYNKEILSTHTHNRHATLHMNVSKHCAATHHNVLKLKKNAIWKHVTFLYFEFFFALCSKKPIQETFIVSFFSFEAKTVY